MERFLCSFLSCNSVLFEHTQNGLSVLLSLEQVAGKWMKGADRQLAAGQSAMWCRHGNHHAHVCCVSPRRSVEKIYQEEYGMRRRGNHAGREKISFRSAGGVRYPYGGELLRAYSSAELILSA